MASGMQFMSPSKNVLQQTNSNVPAVVGAAAAAAAGAAGGGKPEKEAQRRKRRLPQETENRAITSRSPTVAGKLRRVRLDVSSQKLGARNASYGYCRFSSDETGDDEDGDGDGEGDEDGEEGGFGGASERKVRKPTQRPIIPNYVTKSDKGQYRKRRKARGDATDLSSHREGKTQASISIAKRNARERNRVKLVNQGFATLRSRIPDYISEIYTEERKKKKVSKVETLRMALGYIRHLTEMLELRSGDPSEWFQIKGEDSSTGYPSPGDTEYQQSPSTADGGGGGMYGSRESAFYDYDLELDSVKDLSVRSGDGDEEEVLLPGGQFREDKEALMLSESAFSVDVGCCYDLVKPEDGEEPKKTPPLPSITESFPKKSLRAFYETPPFLSGSSAFHV